MFLFKYSKWKKVGGGYEHSAPPPIFALAVLNNSSNKLVLGFSAEYCSNRYTGKKNGSINEKTGNTQYQE